MPAVGGICSVRFFTCDSLPFVGKKYAGITLFDSIYLLHSLLPVELNNRDAIELIFHELVHIEQFRRERIFPAKYLYRLATHGYWSHPAEIEARQRAAELMHRYLSESR